MIHTKRISITVLSGIIVEVLNKIAPLIILHVAQKRLGLENFGYALFGITVIELALPFLTFGYNQFATIEGGKDPKSMSRLMANVFVLKGLHFLALLAFLLSFFYYVPSYQKYFPLMVPLSLMLLFSVVESFWVQAASQKVIVSNILVGVCRFLGLGFILLFIDNASDAILFAILSLATNSLVSLLSAVHSIKTFGLSRPDFSGIRKIVRKSQPYTLIALITIIGERMDIFFAEHFGGLAGAGFYAGSARLSHSLMQIANVVITAFFSEMVIVKSKDVLRSHMKISVRILVFLLAPIVFGVWFVDGDILSLIYDENFRSVKSLLGWLFLSATFALFTASFGQQVLIVQGQVRTYVKALTLGTVVALILAYFGAQTGSLSAIAIAMCIGKGISAVYVVWAVARSLQFFPHKEILASVIPAACMALVLYFLPLNNFIYKIVVGATIYFLIAAFFNRDIVTMLLKFAGRLNPAFDKSGK